MKNLLAKYKKVKEVVNLPKSNVFDEMQKEYKKAENEKFIVENTIKHPEITKNWSEEKLKKLDELYDKKIAESERIIAKNDKIIAELKKKLKKVSG